MATATPVTLFRTGLAVLKNGALLQCPVQYTKPQRQDLLPASGLTKTGKSKYYFSMRLKGDLVDSIPEDYEIYEEPPRAQVFLQRKPPQAITDSEKAHVENALAHLKGSKRYFVQVRGKIITIFESNEDLDDVGTIFDSSPFSFLRSRLEETLNRSLTYTAVMRSTLIDEKYRALQSRAYSFSWCH